MKTIILSAGQAPFGDRPIFDADINGSRLIDLQVAVLGAAGTGDIAIVTGFGGDVPTRADLTVFRNEQWRETGAIGSLAAALPWLHGDDDVLIVYGDVLFSVDALTALQGAAAGISALCYLDRRDGDIGEFREYARIDEGRLAEVLDRAVGSGVRTVFTGMILVRSDRVAALRSYLEERLFPPAGHLGALINSMIRHGADVTPVIVENGWAEVGNQRQFERLLEDGAALSQLLPIHVDWSSRARSYDKLDWVNNDRLLSTMIDVAREEPATCVLDLGTGTGKVLLALRAAMPSGEFWGVDHSKDMLSRVAERHGLTLRQDDAHTLATLPDGYFDLVSARMMFHHIEDTDQALSSAHRVMKPGGRMMVCEGVPPSLRTVDWYTDMFRYKEDRKTLTEVDLILMMVRAGFDDVRTRTVVLRDASLNNWLDNSGIPAENIRKIKDIHYGAPDYVKADYDMRAVDGDCLMTWRFAVVCGRKPERPPA